VPAAVPSDGDPAVSSTAWLGHAIAGLPPTLDGPRSWDRLRHPGNDGVDEVRFLFRDVCGNHELEDNKECCQKLRICGYRKQRQRGNEFQGQWELCSIDAGGTGPFIAFLWTRPTWPGSTEQPFQGTRTRRPARRTVAT